MQEMEMDQILEREAERLAEIEAEVELEHAAPTVITRSSPFKVAAEEARTSRLRLLRLTNL